MAFPADSHERAEAQQGLCANTHIQYGHMHAHTNTRSAPAGKCRINTLSVSN